VEKSVNTELESCGRKLALHSASEGRGQPLNIPFIIGGLRFQPRTFQMCRAKQCYALYRSFR